MNVSALIPTYNRREYVFRAIDSVLRQTVPVDEIIVVDDGSTDGTAEAIRSRYGSRVAVFSQKNSGVSVARKRAIEEARGKWMAFLDSDDEWVPERNAALLKAASLVPETVAWIFGDSEYVWDKGPEGTIYGELGLVIDDDPRIFDHPISELIWDCKRPRPCVLESSFIRRSALQELQCFAEGLRHTEDFLASLQVASRYSFAAIPHVVTEVYRTSDLRDTSLERNGFFSEDHHRGAILGYAVAGQTAGAVPWGALHATSVRTFCGARARQGLPIRRLALDQFKFGISARSVLFFSAAMLGSRLYRAALAARDKLQAVAGRINRSAHDAA